MKIAVPYENGQIFQHFGSTECFKIYDIADGKTVAAATVGTDGNGHGALAAFLQNLGVDTLICGGIGGGAKSMLSEVGIQLYGGVSGEADKAVVDMLSGALRFDPDVSCTHHEEQHGGSDSCGECAH
ncbi:MAG: NifB/NifX family molybdenum-iron cluster-binding protein [Ethanoligenens sp.]